jgi:hypothetical protein
MQLSNPAYSGFLVGFIYLITLFKVWFGMELFEEKLMPMLCLLKCLCEFFFFVIRCYQILNFWKVESFQFIVAKIIYLALNCAF